MGTRLILLFGLMVCAATLHAKPLVNGDADAGKTRAAACAACHGAQGNKESAQFPKLAGQGAPYIYEQLKYFKSGKRENAIMAGQAAGLSDQDMKNVAAYFASQQTKPGVADPTIAPAGASLYHGGLPDKNVPACSGCHGPSGLGNPAAKFPRLSGQNSQYIVTQLQAYRGGKRSGYHKASIMDGVAENLSDNDIKALASYVSGLAPVRKGQHNTNGALMQNASTKAAQGAAKGGDAGQGQANGSATGSQSGAGDQNGQAQTPAGASPPGSEPTGAAQSSPSQSDQTQPGQATAGSSQAGAGETQPAAASQAKDKQAGQGQGQTGQAKQQNEPTGASQAGSGSGPTGADHKQQPGQGGAGSGQAGGAETGQAAPSRAGNNQAGQGQAEQANGRAGRRQGQSGDGGRGAPAAAGAKAGTDGGKQATAPAGGDDASGTPAGAGDRTPAPGNGAGSAGRPAQAPSGDAPAHNPDTTQSGS